MKTIDTRKGKLRFPTYFPVTTFGKKYPLDNLIRPYLPRLSQGIMVSYHYAKDMKEETSIPLLLDSGGFASLFESAVVKEEQGMGVIRVSTGDEEETIDPITVLDRQEDIADIAFTLDFPIPPGSSVKEATKRMELTINNAKWALENRRRKDLLLYGCIQAPDPDNSKLVARSLSKLPFNGFALGGMVPRMSKWDLVEKFVESTLGEIGDRPLHVFGVGKPDRVRRLFEIGVSSVDSSSYVKAAADGVCWSDTDNNIKVPGTFDRVGIALKNLATWRMKDLPLSFLQEKT